MSEDFPSLPTSFEDTTHSLSSFGEQLADLKVPGLTILCHPLTERVGEVAALPALLAGQVQELSRRVPHFSSPGGGTPKPLAEAHLSRKPVLLRGLPNGGVQLDPGATTKPIIAGGRKLSGPIDFSKRDLEEGIFITLSPLIAVFLHALPPLRKRPPSFGLVGESGVMLELRREIERLARLPYPTLLRGESGTGKELVARALHEAGTRRDRPWVSVNMAAVPSSLAAAELFGTSQGAYTGAGKGRDGHLRRADGGTLFLDEIGDTPADVQVLLLRALETGKIQPLGAAEPVEIDIRLVSATDVDIESAIELGEYRSSLYHRLTGCELEVPPLRHRKEDIGRLFFHFLRKELEVARESFSADIGAPEWPPVPAKFIARLLDYPWPGNVRELRNVVRQLVVANVQKQHWRVPSAVERRLEGADRRGSTRAIDASEPGHTSPQKLFRSPDEISNTELVGTLRQHRWNVRRTAETLGLSRPSLYRLMKDSSKVRLASDLGQEELENAFRACGGDLEALVDHLQVSKRALQLRLSELGINKRD